MSTPTKPGAKTKGPALEALLRDIQREQAAIREDLRRLPDEVAEQVVDQLERRDRRGQLERIVRDARTPRVDRAKLLALFELKHDQLAAPTETQRALLSRLRLGKVQRPKLSTAEAHYAARGGDPAEVTALLEEGEAT